MIYITKVDHRIKTSKKEMYLNKVFMFNEVANNVKLILFSFFWQEKIMSSQSYVQKMDKLGF